MPPGRPAHQPSTTHHPPPPHRRRSRKLPPRPPRPRPPRPLPRSRLLRRPPPPPLQQSPRRPGATTLRPRRRRRRAAACAAGGAVLAAAGVLVLLAAHRMRQQRRRHPGQRIPMPPPDVAATELELRTVEDPVSVARLDAALRSLAFLSAAADRRAPGLSYAALTAQRLRLHLVEPSQLPRSSPPPIPACGSWTRPRPYPGLTPWTGCPRRTRR